MKNVLRGLGNLQRLGCGNGYLNGLGDVVCTTDDPTDGGFYDCDEIIDVATGQQETEDVTTYTPGSTTATEVDTWTQATPAEIAAATTATTGGSHGMTTAEATAAGLLTTIAQQAAVQGGRWLARTVNGQTVYYPQGGGFSSFNLSGMMPLLLLGGAALLLMTSSKG